MSFAICGLIGVVISGFGLKMNKEIDTEGQLRSDLPKKQEFWMNMGRLKDALKTPSIYKTLLYFVLCGMLVPTFSDVNYFFQLNVLEFSKLTYSMLTLISFFSLLFGTMFYNKFLQDWEFRTLL
jgi:Na+/melibiose symporter-like transporter